MSKSVYSVVLSDDVISEIDRLAYNLNTNRSNMINQILAEYVSYTTPEKRIKEVFDRIRSVFDGRDVFRLAPPSDTMMSFGSPLAYKYNPTVRYAVELYRDISGAVGELRVTLRSQNSTLLLYMMQFYKLWEETERHYIGDCDYSIDGGKLIRKLNLRLPPEELQSLSAVDLGDIIADYVSAFDSALKSFFYDTDSRMGAAERIDAIYRDYLHASGTII